MIETWVLLEVLSFNINISINASAFLEIIYIYISILQNIYPPSSSENLFMSTFSIIEISKLLKELIKYIFWESKLNL